MARKQLVADIVEITDQRHIPAKPFETVADPGHGIGAFVAVDGDADDFRSGLVKGGNLSNRCIDIGGVGIGHRLDDDRRTAADRDITDPDRYRLAAR